MAEVPILDNAANMAKIKAGMQGGPFNKQQASYPSVKFVNGFPAEVTGPMQSSGMMTPVPMENPWFNRRK